MTLEQVWQELNDLKNEFYELKKSLEPTPQYNPPYVKCATPGCNKGRSLQDPICRGCRRKNAERKK